MKRYLLDSGILTLLINRDVRVVQRAEQITASGNMLGTCVPVFAEMIAGLQQSSSKEKNVKKLERAVATMKLWPFDLVAAHEYGQIDGELVVLGRPMQVIDMMIGAIARSLGRCIVVTTDSDLKAIPGLTVENWAND